MLSHMEGTCTSRVQKLKNSIYERLAMERTATKTWSTLIFAGILGKIHKVASEDTPCMALDRIKNFIKGTKNNIMAGAALYDMRFPVESVEPLYELFPEETVDKIKGAYKNAALTHNGEEVTPPNLLKMALRSATLKKDLHKLTLEIHKIVPFAVLRAARGCLAGRAEAQRRGFTSEILDSILLYDVEGDICLLSKVQCKSVIAEALESSSQKETLREKAALLKGTSLKKITDAQRLVLSEIRKNILRI
jgi:hypothetical protein